MAEGTNIGTVTGRVELDDQMSSGLDILAHKIDDLDNKFGGLGHSFAEGASEFFTAQAALDAVKEAAHLAAEGVSELVVQGSKVAGVEAAFDNLTGGAGRLGDTLLGALQQGTKGTVTNFELMQSANRDLAAGMNLTDQQFKTLASGAYALAKATGTDVNSAFERINDAMLTGRTRAVALLTGKIDLAAAEQTYAAKLGVSVDQLTAEGKVEAGREAILNAVSAATKRAGDAGDSLGIGLQKVSTSVQNFVEDLGKVVATSPVLAAGLQGLEGVFGSTFGDDRQAMIAAIAHKIDDMAIGVINLAKVVVDGVGVMGVEWNALVVVWDMVKGGWDAIVYAIEGGLLLIEKGLNAVSFGAFDDQVKTLTTSMDGWYNAMAVNQKGIDDHKKAEQDWAVATGNIKDKLEEVRLKMVAAEADTKDYGAATKQASADGVEGSNADAAAHDNLTKSVGLTKEQIKLMAEATKEMNSVGGTWRETLNQIDGDTVSAIKYYLDAGIAQNKLAAAYGLTEVQVKAIAEANKADAAGMKELTAAVAAEQAAENDLVKVRIDLQQRSLKNMEADDEAALQKRYAAGLINEQQYQTQLYSIKVDYERKSEALYQQQEENEEAKVQDGLTKQLADLQAQYDAAKLSTEDYEKIKTTITQTAEDKREAIREKYDADRKDRMRQEEQDLGQVATATAGVGQQIQLLDHNWVTDADIAQATLDKTTVMVKQLDGEIVSLAEAQKRQQAGGSFDVTSQNFNSTIAGFGIDVSAATNLARQGYSLTEIVTYLGTGHGTGPVPPPAGPRIPGFKEGGAADFGVGTLAILHGPEAIVPLDKAGGLAGNITNVFHVNGTAEESARKIWDILMRQMKSQRQFGSA